MTAISASANRLLVAGLNACQICYKAEVGSSVYLILAMEQEIEGEFRVKH